jgi:hypothetical protein
MANALLLLDNFADYAIVEASTELGTAPVANLQNTRRSSYWRSESINDTSDLDFTLLAAPDGTGSTHVALVDVNLTVNGTIRVRAWSDAVGGASLVIDQTVTPTLFTSLPLPSSLYYGTYGPGPYGVVDYGPVNQRNVTLITLSVPTTALYWRVTLTDTNTSYQQCSRVFIGKGVTLANNMAYGWTAEYLDNSVEKKSIAGQRYSQPRDSQLQITGNYDRLSDAERTTMLINARRFGKTRPIIFSLFPENTDQGQSTTIYGVLSGLKLSNTDFGKNEMPIIVTEDL